MPRRCQPRPITQQPRVQTRVHISPIQQKQKENEDLQQKLSEAEQSLISANAKTREKENDIRSLECQLRDERRKCSISEATKERQEQKINELEQKLRQKEQYLTSAEAKTKTKENDIRLLRQKLCDETRKCSTAEAARKRQEQETNQLKQKLSEAEQSLTSANAEITEKRINIGALKHKLSDAQKAYETLDTAKEQKEQEINSLKQELSRAEHEHTNAEAEIRQKKTDIESLNNQLSQEKQSLNKSESSNQQKDQQITELNQEVTSLKEQIVMKRYGITYDKGKSVDDVPKETIKEYNKSLHISLMQTFLDVADDKGKGKSQDVEAEKIIELSNLIREGNDRLQVNAEHAILLLGNTGAGKSTLAHVLAGKKLYAMENDKADLILDAVEVLPHIAIGLGNKSETTVPNRCLAKDDKTVIWDCPGFNDTDVAQDIANSFYIKKLFEISKNMKFVLVFPEAGFRIDRGSKFIDTVKQFVTSFSDISSLEDSLSIVISQVPPRKQTHHIETTIKGIIEQNNQATPEVKNLVSKVMEKSLHIFHQPKDEGDYESPHIFADITASTEFIEAKADMANLEVSERAREYSAELLSTAKDNFFDIAILMAHAITEATDANVYDENNILIKNEKLVSDWLPAAAKNWNISNSRKQGHFLKQQQLASMKDILESSTIDNIDQFLDVMERLFEIIQEFANPADHNHLLPMRQYISKYPYVLKQQYEYIKFFSKICKKDVPSHQAFAEMINVCESKVSENLEYQVKTMELNDSDNAEYYKEAIKYLDMYPDSRICKDLKASAYVKLGGLVVNDPQQAIDYYVAAIEANKQLPDIYKKMGKLFANQQDYEKAISCFKVIKRSDKVKECFKEILKTKKGDEKVDVLIKKGDYFVSIGNKEKAISCYSDAFGKAKNEDKKAEAHGKHIEMIKGSPEITKYFDELVSDHRDYNFDLVDEQFVVDLMG